MNDKALTKLWSVLGLASLLFGWAAAARSRGLSAKSSVVIDVGGLLPHASSLLSFLVLAVLIALTLFVPRQYAIRHLADGWAKRLPLAFFDAADVNVAEPLGALYQKVMLFGFLVLPTVFLLVVFNVFMEATTFDEDGHLFVSGWRQLIAVANVNWFDALTGQYRFGAANGPSYYPLIQPWLYLGFVGYVVYSSVRTLRMIVR